MRHVGHEVLAYAFEVFQFGDIVQNRDRAAPRAFAQRRGLYFKDAAARGHEGQPPPRRMSLEQHLR